MGLMGMDGNAVDKVSWFVIGCIGVCRHKWLFGLLCGDPNNTEWSLYDSKHSIFVGIVCLGMLKREEWDLSVRSILSIDIPRWCDNLRHYRKR